MNIRLASFLVSFFSFSALSVAPVAADATSETLNSSPALGACVEEAQERELEAWLCMGGRLTTPGGSGINSDEPEEAGVPFETVAEDEVTIESGGTQRSFVDDYDDWCEASDICHRPVNAWSNETKGNATFGNADGPVGSFDVVIHTRLNGRTPSYETAFIWDMGPFLSFNEVHVQCREVEPRWPDTNCGMFMVDGELGRFDIHEGNYRENFGPLYGNRLEDPLQYYGTVEGYVFAQWYGPMGMPPLTSQEFYCPPIVEGDEPCSFPLE